MEEETNVPQGHKVIIDHIYRPYCSGFNLLKMVAAAFDNIEVRRYNVNKLDERRLTELPSYVEMAVRAGEPQDFGGIYYVGGKLVRPDVGALEHAIEREGGVRAENPSIWRHPVPKPIEGASGLLVRRITADDINGSGEPLPSFWCDLNASDPEVKMFLLRATEKQGCCMMGAYIDGAVCGFVTFFNSETRELPNAQPISDASLRITCLHVFPHKRRQGVGTALVNEVINFAREKGYRKVVANSGCSDLGDAFKGTPAGARSIYNKLGFQLVAFKEPTTPGGQAEAIMELPIEVKVHTPSA